MGLSLDGFERYPLTRSDKQLTLFLFPVCLQHPFYHFRALLSPFLAGRFLIFLQSLDDVDDGLVFPTGPRVGSGTWVVQQKHLAPSIRVGDLQYSSWRVFVFVGNIKGHRHHPPRDLVGRTQLVLVGVDEPDGLGVVVHQRGHGRPGGHGRDSDAFHVVEGCHGPGKVGDSLFRGPVEGGQDAGFLGARRRDQDDVAPYAGLDPTADGDAGHLQRVIQVDPKDLVTTVVLVVPKIGGRLEKRTHDHSVEIKQGDEGKKEKTRMKGKVALVGRK